MTRNCGKWKYKYRPGVECLECKQLLSPGLYVSAVPDVARVTSLVAAKPESRNIHPDGTGTGIRIPTS